MKRTQGKVIWFNTRKGFGEIETSQGIAFLSAYAGDGKTKPKPGDILDVELKKNKQDGLFVYSFKRKD